MENFYISQDNPEGGQSLVPRLCVALSISVKGEGSGSPGRGKGRQVGRSMASLKKGKTQRGRQGAKSTEVSRRSHRSVQAQGAIESAFKASHLVTRDSWETVMPSTKFETECFNH